MYWIIVRNIIIITIQQMDIACHINVITNHIDIAKISFVLSFHTVRSLKYYKFNFIVP